METSKYIILNNERAIILPVSMNHSDLYGIEKITSAGFINFDLRCTGIENRDTFEDLVFVSTYGESVSLNLKSNKEDATLVCCTLNGFDMSEKIFKIDTGA